MTTPFDPMVWKLAHGRELALGPAGVLMAIINVTPDSFSDGGLNIVASNAIENALRAIDEGAVIVDIGTGTGIFAQLACRVGARRVYAIEPDDEAFAWALLEAENVAVMPGTSFGEAARGHVRVSLCQPDAVLTEAAARLRRFVSRYRSKAA